MNFEKDQEEQGSEIVEEDEASENISEVDSETEKKLIEMYKKKLSKVMAQQKQNTEYENTEKMVKK